MKLSTLEFIKLLPEFMRDDEAVKGLAAGIDAIIPGLAESFKTLTTWDHIDKLSEAELDDMAWELNIPWYNTGANIEVKRELIKNSDKIHKTLGTKAAVENVVSSYFGSGKVVEWFEYGGEPGFFQVHSTNPTMSDERMDEFIHLLNQVKRASAKLDSIFIELSGRMTLAAGVALHEVGAERHIIGRK